MRDAAVTIGVSQHVLETEYYMVDLPAILDRLRERRAIDRLERIQDMQIAFGRYEEKDAKRMIGDLVRDTGASTNNGNKFDRDAFERLRAMTAQGANKSR